MAQNLVTGFDFSQNECDTKKCILGVKELKSSQREMTLKLIFLYHIVQPCNL